MEENIKGTVRKLKVASLNVQGLRNPKKRNTLFRQFKKNKLDIIALQETYLLIEDKHLIEKAWDGPFHITEGTKHSKGLLTLFNNSFKEEDIAYTFVNDRLIFSAINFDDNPLVIGNIYGPCEEKEKMVFFKELTNIIEIHVDKENASWLLMGDMNITKHKHLDLISGFPHSIKSIAEFNTFTNHFNLVDVWRLQNKSKKEYTWCRKNSRNLSFSARRLDYIFTNSNLFPFSQDASIQNFGFSDHRLVSLTFDFCSCERGPPSFKLNVNLLKDLHFINNVKNEIEETKTKNTELDPHLMWELIKIKIKSAAISFGKKKAVEKKSEKCQLSYDLAESESKLSETPNDQNLIAKVENIKRKLELHLLNETEGARIRAGIKWAQLGEKCNNFFLNLGKQRARNETIFRIMNNKDEMIKENDGILACLSSHYESIYKIPPDKPNQNSLDDIFCKQDPNFSLSEEEADSLEGQITEEELHRAVSSMNNGSSPGLDGIPAEVYKVFFLDIKDVLLKNIKHSFETKTLSLTQTHGVIKLLHKGKGLDREVISCWRPITLLNTDYKILAKVIARRLNKVLGNLIDQNQYAFIKGRNSGDMIREIDDIIELEKIKGEKSMLLSIDYAKAFDTLSTDAIMKAMKIYGFKEHFLEWIQILLKERKSCIKNNNYISRFFDMERGVRQGCPLSPLLFICTVELLARNIRNDKKIKGIKISQNSRPAKIRQFADDTTLFLRDQMDFREVLSKIKQFAVFSGLELNKNKSMVMIMENKQAAKHNIYDIQVVNKVKILGIYLSNRKQPTCMDDNYTSKIENLEKLCKLWSKRNLSIIGKIIVIKTFGISLFTHVINSIGIDTETISTINKILYKFIWNNSNTDKKTIEKVKRTTLCNKKHEGGLNMIDLSDFQAGFYLKWAEQLINTEQYEWKTAAISFFKPLGGISVFKSSLDIKVCKEINLIKSTFWRRVLETWLTFNKNKNTKLNGASPIFKNCDITYKNKMLFMPQLIKRKAWLLKDIIKDGKLMTKKDIETKFGAYPGLILDYNVLFNALKKINLRFDIVREDIFYFQGMKVDKIGRKNMMKLIRKTYPPVAEQYWDRHLNVRYNKKRWFLPFKITKETQIQILQWKIAHNIYPTAIMLEKMGIRRSDKCKYCDEKETLAHFFFECYSTKQIWLEIENNITFSTGKRIKLKAAEALLGFIPECDRTKKEYFLINQLILIGKLVISKMKYGPQRDPKELLESEIKTRTQDLGSIIM